MAETARMGRREKNRVRTRQALQGAAIDLADERGFDAINVEEITERADVSTRTFFRYFDSKPEVLLADGAERLARLRSLLDRPEDEPIGDSLEVVLRGLLEGTPQYRHLYEAQVRHAPTSRALMGAVRLRELDLSVEIAAFVDRRVSNNRGGIVGSVVGAAVVAACNAGIIGWVLDPRHQDEPDADEIVAALAGLSDLG